MTEKIIKCHWKAHTPSLLKEIAECSGQPVLRTPLNIFGRLLAQVAERAAQLNDERLNALMMRLTLYDQADPYSADYDESLVKKYDQI